MPDTAAEAPKSVELELRIARLELVVKDLLDQIETRDKAAMALRAELDHLTARLFHT